jgi:gliding motility-associated-like protein
VQNNSSLKKKTILTNLKARYMKQFLTLFILFISAATMSQAQTILMNAATNGTRVNNCGGDFFDSGGTAGNYGNNENYTITICSTSPAITSKFIRLSFDAPVTLAPGDQLCFFDGLNTSAPSLGCLGGADLSFSATALNTSGCITARFTSDGSGVAAGWHAVVSCAKGCQQISAALDSTNPIVMPRDTGWMDVCLGSRVFLKGKGTYPQNGLVGAYTQNDSLTSFEWNFGDASRIEYGPSVFHTFQNAGGYIIQLNLTDTAKCQNANFISQRVRVAPRPKFNVGNVPSQICVGQEVRLNAITASLSNIYTVGVRPDTGYFPQLNSRSDSVYLPDGTGQDYATTIRFNNFAPGARLTNITDLEYIFVNMEHSFIGDLQISIVCPNGQTSILRTFAGIGAANGSFDLGVSGTGTNNGVVGYGYEYRWTPQATQTWRQYLVANPVQPNNTLPPSVRPVAPTVPTQGNTLANWRSWTGPLVNYAAEDPSGLNGLLGCPLNGTWQIVVRDFWNVDDGFIFGWGMKFNTRLYPNIETFVPVITQHGWTDNPFITQNNRDSIRAVPRNAGTASFFYQVTDTFGCKNDTFVNIRVLPFTNPACYTCNTNFNKLRDTSICIGDSVRLDNRGVNLNQPVTFEAFPYKKINRTTFGLTPFYSPNDISNIKPITITNPTTQIDSVCIDVETFFPNYLDLRLVAPNNSEVILFNNNRVGIGQSLRGTCFTTNPAVTRTLGTSPQPYSGQVYQAENGAAAWNALIGAPINGTWKLSAKVNSGTADHTISRWSLTLKYKNDATYTWTPNTDLSCLTCGNPTARPRSTTTYFVTSVDSFNCTKRDTVTITIRDSLAAPSGVFANDVQNNHIRFTWNPVIGATGYEVRLNGTGPWIAPNLPPREHQINGLRPGNVVSIEVRALGTAICGARIASATREYNRCIATIGGSLQIDSIVCYGQASPFVNFSNATGITPLTYTIDTTVQDRNPIFRNIKYGRHFAYLQDGDGCRDSLAFTIGQPDSMLMTLRADSVLCKGTATGRVVATTIGLSGSRRAVTPYTYQWNSSATTTNTASNLFAGIVRVTVSDGSGCQKTDTIRVFEPDSLLIGLRRDSARCYGTNTGLVKVTARGGSPQYRYLWNYNATTTDSIANAPARMYTVTVTDAKNCTRIDSIRVLQADSLTINFLKQDVNCANGATGTARALITGGSSPYTFAWSNGDTDVLADSLRSGIYTVTVADRNGCTKTARVTIIENTAIATSMSSVAARCYGAATGRGTVRTSGGISPYTFAWDSRVFDSIATNLNVGLHFVTITDALGCRKTDSVQVAQPDSIRFDSLSSTPALCNSSPTGSARVVASGGTSPYSYAWTPLNQATQTARNLIPGVYTIRVTDANSCFKTDTVRVQATAPLLIDSIRFVSNNCFNDNTASASVYPSGGAGGFTYRWSDVGFQTTQTASNIRAGSYAVTVTDLNSCQIVGNVTVTQPSQLVASQLGIKPVSCKNGEDGEARPMVSGGTPLASGRYGYNYRWNDLLSQTDSVATGLKVGTYIVTVTDAKGCTDTATIYVSEPASGVEADATQTALGCFGTSTSRASVVARGGAGNYTYQWSNTQNTPEATGLSRQTYYVTVTDIRGCKIIDTLPVTTYDSIAVALSTTQPLCYGYANGTVLIDSIRGGSGSGNLNSYNYVWNTSPRQIGTRAIGLLGSRTYVVTVTDQNGCFNIANTYLNQPGQILLGTVATPVSCFGGTNGVAQVTAQGTNNNFTYLWEQAARSQTTARATDLAAGRYRVTITDSSNCRLDTSVVITEPARLRMADKVITPNKCVGDSLGQIEIRITGGTPIYKYYWSSTDTLARTSKLRAGTYYLSVTDIKGCLLFDTIVLPQPSAILAQASAIPVNCFGARDGRIDLRVSGGLPPYQFSTDNRAYNGISSIVGLKADDYDVYVRDANNCLWFNRVSIPTPPKMTVDAGVNVNINLGQSVQLIATPANNRGAVTYLWRAPYDSTLSCTRCPNPTAAPLYTINYNVLVRDSAGCTADDNILVTVFKYRSVYVPTAFTPNTDNVNDILRVRGYEGTKIKSYRIYDRWGELIYEARNFNINDVNYGWDGTFKGQPMPAGMYVWYVEADYVDAEQESFKGNTMLLR